jgi:phage gpG-like protein
MPIQVSLDDSAAARELAKFEAAYNDPTPLNRAIADGLLKNFNKRFDARIDPDGKAWMPWADSTHAQRMKQKQGKLLEFSNPGMRDTVRKLVTKYGASLTLLSPIAGFHEQLEPARKGKLPRRAMLFSKNGGLGAMDQKTVEQASSDYFRKMMF